MVNSNLSQDVGRIIEEVRERSLAPLACEMAKLICLSSTRDYNTGRYQHDGLDWRYRDKDADAALRALHTQIFESLVVAPLKTLVSDLEAFFGMTLTDRSTATKIWKNLEPFRIAVPEDSDELTRKLFYSNIRIALAVLENRQSKMCQDQQSTSPML